MSMEEKRKITRAERAATVGPLDRLPDDLEKPLLSTASNKPLPEVTEPVTEAMSTLNIQDSLSIEEQTRKALTDPRIFEAIPAAFSLSFVLGKQPANPDTLSLEQLLDQGQYFLVIQRTQHLLTANTSLPLPDLWSLWLLRAECLRLLLAPRLAALELSRIIVPLEAKIPWDFQVLKILLVGMASGKWSIAIEEWIVVAGETRFAMSLAEDKGIWRARLRKLEELIVYGLIEGRKWELAGRQLRTLIKRYPQDNKYVINLFHVYLQTGLVSSAEQLISSLPSSYAPQAVALLSLSKDNFIEAINQYTALLETSKSLLLATNFSLAHLYSANVQSAIQVLKPILNEPGTERGVLSHAVYNLCTMYEIRDDLARRRKEEIMESIVSNYGDICGKGQFKLDSLR